MGYESVPLPSYPELINCSYYVKLITPSRSTPQAHLPHLDPTIEPTNFSPSSAPPQDKMHIWVLQATLSDMVLCRLFMYTPMGWSPAASIASTTDGYSHSPPALLFSSIPVIRRAAQWWNPSSTMIVSLHRCSYPLYHLCYHAHRIRDFHRFR